MSGHPGHLAHLAHMAGMGLLVSVVAPLLAVALRPAGVLDRVAPPAVLALPGFAVLHAAVTVGTHGLPPLSAASTAAHLLMLAGAVLFWWPVFGGRRLSEPRQVLYLFTAAPVLDLAGVWVVARGDGAGGLAMIVGMLPLALVAMGVTWRWIVREEEQAAAL
ncbi:cytochrome c oxidase assembly protein [Pseudonocardia oceani]|nr:cytochrome c oxidase assembly protein [Pseudonocardia oceani]